MDACHGQMLYIDGTNPSRADISQDHGAGIYINFPKFPSRGVLRLA